MHNTAALAAHWFPLMDVVPGGHGFVGMMYQTANQFPPRVGTSSVSETSHFETQGSQGFCGFCVFFSPECLYKALCITKHLTLKKAGVGWFNAEEKDINLPLRFAFIDFQCLTSPALLGRLPRGRGRADLPWLPTEFAQAETKDVLIPPRMVFAASCLSHGLKKGVYPPPPTGPLWEKVRIRKEAHVQRSIAHLHCRWDLTVPHIVGAGQLSVVSYKIILAGGGQTAAATTAIVIGLVQFITAARYWEKMLIDAIHGKPYNIGCNESLKYISALNGGRTHPLSLRLIHQRPRLMTTRRQTTGLSDHTLSTYLFKPGDINCPANKTGARITHIAATALTARGLANPPLSMQCGQAQPAVAMTTSLPMSKAVRGECHLVPTVVGRSSSEDALGFLHLGIMLDDALVQQVFSGIYHFPCLCILVLLHTHLASASSTLKSLIAYETLHGYYPPLNQLSGVRYKDTMLIVKVSPSFSPGIYGEETMFCLAMLTEVRMTHHTIRPSSAAPWSMMLFTPLQTMLLQPTAFWQQLNQDNQVISPPEGPHVVAVIYNTTTATPFFS
ncbi:hypothetical protein PR048_012801 [Dryococelus australis]|uniref:Uncharacterized protein n=1 Tax=Dryococelus australis TaxID=614101 RepID=A0ABQ9HQE1_9NEOP|nr:hypothetical protein PR048_012801 [Dryococelus australis]